jgi:cytochrome c biogenesis protein CcmG/thiol:disulfide interchange protein DsbE
LVVKASSKVLRSLLWVTALAAVIAGCGDEAPKLTTGAPTPAFSLERLSGASLHFPDDLQGKVVAIRFWADWCPFCEGEMRDLEPVYRRLRDQGLVILAINVRQDRERAAAFVKKSGISYEVLLDTDGKTARRYGVTGLPTSFLVGRDGKLHTRIIGESTPDVFTRIVGELL